MWWDHGQRGGQAGRATVAVDLYSTEQDDVPIACVPRVVECNDGGGTEEEPSAKEDLFSPGSDASLLSTPRWLMGSSPACWRVAPGAGSWSMPL